MNKVSVKAHTRKSKNGKTVSIKAHERKARSKKSVAGQTSAGQEFEKKQQVESPNAAYEQGLKGLSASDKAAWVAYEKKRMEAARSGKVRQGLFSSKSTPLKSTSKRDEVFQRLEDIQTRNKETNNTKRKGLFGGLFGKRF